MNTIQKNVYGRQLTLTGDQQDGYFNELSQEGIMDSDIIRLIRVSSTSESNLVDVGANIGYVSLVMGVLSPKGKVFAFEPGSETFKLLKNNLDQNTLNNIVPYNFGLSDKNRSAILSHTPGVSSGGFVDSSGSRGGHVSSAIKLKKLDNEYKKIGIKKCDFIKVDIEGHELEFLSGARKFINEHKPLVVLEANHWCQSVFNRVTLPEYIEQVFNFFPEVFAFHEGCYLDLSDLDARYKFFHQNIVFNKYFNIYCGFNKREVLNNLELAFKTEKVRQELSETIAGLKYEINSLSQSRSHRLASRINKILRR